MWSLYFCCFASLVSMRLCDSMLPFLSSGLGIDSKQSALAISMFALGYGLMQIFFGPAGDRYGKLRVIAVATLAGTIGNVGAALSLSAGQLVAARILSGAAVAGIVPLTMAWIGDQVSYGRRQEVLAKLLGATVFGTIVGQWAGGAIPAVGNWRSTFLLMAAIFLVAGTITALQSTKKFVESGKAQGSFFDNVRTVLALPWARLVLLITLIEGALVYSALAFIPTHLHSAFGLPMYQTGLIVGLYGLGGLAYSRVAGVLLRHMSELQFPILGGLLLMSALLTLGLSRHWAFALPACFLGGFGFYALHNTLQLNATQMAPACRGTAVSLFSCFLFFGQTIGISVAAVVIQVFSTDAFFVCAGIGLLATAGVFSTLLHRKETCPVSSVDV
ncbi:MFS transporter [Paraburkholderia tropica]|uniref:MFS transporter n=1 Tax=Paraburkholderia tropica TaxID=92647 RepID=UPI002AB60E35|nr:MFS transporter [Paraburkholderia tropica]